LAEDSTHIRDLDAVLGAFYAWNLNTDLIRTTWTVTQSDVAIKDGYPFGWIRYAQPGTEQVTVVAVRWDQHEGQLQCTAVDTSVDTDELAGLERDARLRAGCLLTAYAHLGSSSARSATAQKDFLCAAGLIYQGSPPGITETP